MTNKFVERNSSLINPCSIDSQMSIFDQLLRILPQNVLGHIRALRSQTTVANGQANWCGTLYILGFCEWKKSTASRLIWALILLGEPWHWMFFRCFIRNCPFEANNGFGLISENRQNRYSLERLRNMSTKMTPVLVITELVTPQRVFSNSAEIELRPRPNQIGTERKKTFSKMSSSKSQ